MKILFIGIFDSKEPNTAFRNSLRGISSNYEEISHSNLFSTNKFQIDVQNIIKRQVPDVIFMQLQGANVISDQTLSAMKKCGAFLVQWTGDARQPTPSHYIDFGKKINLSLFGNTEDIEFLTSNGVNADFLQISADETIYTPKSNYPEIVFMGNHYSGRFPLSNFRLEMCRFLKHIYGDRFMVYGTGWESRLNPKNVMYKQHEEADVYRRCKIAINCSHYDLRRYTSDRFFRILLSGAFCLSKEFPKMDEYMPNVNFATFGDLESLRTQIDYYLNNDSIRQEIANNGHQMALSKWKWSDRANELLKLIDKWKNTGQNN
ncbi:glycosyltransferase [uncultured Flavobacterium sp.]|uniref:glycosyltransferase family protein n=1 Tax=uncultured Flavobacterium sp. TaxID=165435 RepID=UPI0025917309|nr:glycosyltransferase [uncultured Flavobacterium sp.]